MAGTRKYNSVDEDTTKLTVVVPKDLDQQLRALASRRGSGVGPMVREWIIKEARAADLLIRQRGDTEKIAAAELQAVPPRTQHGTK